MYNVAQKDSLVEKFTQVAEDTARDNCKDLDLVGFMKANNADLVRESIAKIQNCIIAAIPEGFDIPSASLYVTPTGDGEEITIIAVTLSNRIIADKKFKYSIQATQRDAIETVKDFFIASYTSLLVDKMAEENLAAVNSVLSQASKEAGLSYKVTVASPVGNEGKKVLAMADDTIIFVADEERVFSLDDILVLAEESELVKEEMIQQAYQREVDELATAQTPEQLVQKRGGLLISYLCDINKQIKPMTIIKKVCSKNVKNIKGNKDTIAYYLENDVFALLAKRDGHFEVLLSPFNVNTLRKEEVDVLKELTA